MREKIILVAVWRHAKILVSADLVAMQLAAKIKPAASQNVGRRRPSPCETRPRPHRPATARIPSPPSCLKPLYLGVKLAILAVKPIPQLLVAVFLIVRETISVLRSRSLQSLTQTLLRIEIAAPKFNQNTPASS